MKKVIGISGISRSGKNLFAKIAGKLLIEKGSLKVKEFSLAYELKKDLYDIVMNRTGISTFTEDTKLKNIIRPLLVGYGDLMRDTTEGKYFTSIIQPQIESSDANICFITDIRYDHYPEDECYCLKEKMSGKLIHIRKFVYKNIYNKDIYFGDDCKDQYKSYFPAPNEKEELNDPKVREKADYKLEWEDLSGIRASKLVENSTYMIGKVTEALKAINVI